MRTDSILNKNSEGQSKGIFSKAEDWPKNIFDRQADDQMMKR